MPPDYQDDIAQTPGTLIDCDLLAKDPDILAAEKNLYGALPERKKKYPYIFQRILTTVLFKRAKRGKHIIASIPTGHGKSYIISLLATALVLTPRIDGLSTRVAVVTSSEYLKFCMFTNFGHQEKSGEGMTREKWN